MLSSAAAADTPREKSEMKRPPVATCTANVAAITFTSVTSRGGIQGVHKIVLQRFEVLAVHSCERGRDGDARDLGGVHEARDGDDEVEHGVIEYTGSWRTYVAPPFKQCQAACRAEMNTNLKQHPPQLQPPGRSGLAAQMPGPARPDEQNHMRICEEDWLKAWRGTNFSLPRWPDGAQAALSANIVLYLEDLLSSPSIHMRRSYHEATAVAVLAGNNCEKLVSLVGRCRLSKLNGDMNIDVVERVTEARCWIAKSPAGAQAVVDAEALGGIT
ncbi:hypothetical protein FB451DRAFT_1172371 [Mycena latifolia]|nr:hypothetical protein FB451DRAFT_1172371 [Mycena latifolia]